MADEIHVGDIGTIFEATLVEYDAVLAADVPLNLETATTLELLFRRASGEVVTVDAMLTTDGTDGKIQYTTPDADFLDSAGHWLWQPRLALPDWAGHGDIQPFQVYDNLL